MKESPLSLKVFGLICAVALTAGLLNRTAHAESIDGDGGRYDQLLSVTTDGKSVPNLKAAPKAPIGSRPFVASKEPKMKEAKVKEPKVKKEKEPKVKKDKKVKEPKSTPKKAKKVKEPKMKEPKLKKMKEPKVKKTK